MRRHGLIALRLAVSAVCLWLALGLMPEGTGAGLWRAEPGWLLGLLGCTVGAILLMALRLRLLAGTEFAARTVLGVTWAGQFGATLGLGLLSADAARIATLVRAGAPVGRAAALIVVDRCFGLAGLLVLAGGAWAAHLWGWAGGLGAGCGGAGVVLGALALGARIPRLAAALPIGGLGPGRQAVALGLSVALHGVSILGFLAAALALGAHAPLPETFVAVAIGLFFAILPVSLGGWGVRELAIAQGYLVVGASFDAAIPASLLYGLAVTLAALPGLPVLIGAGPRRGR